MRKFLTVLLAFVLAFTAVFAFAACSDAENDQNGGSNTEQDGNSDGDNNSGDNNSGEDALQPVAMDAFLSGVLQNISEAEGFSITLAATAKGSTSVKAGGGNPISEEIDKTFEGTYAPGADFARQLLALLEKYDLSLTGTVPASADNSGYELILPLTAAELLQTQVVDTVVGFLQENADKQLGDVLAPVLFGGEYAEGEGTAALAAWTAKVFTEQITFDEFFAELDKIFALYGFESADVINVLSLVLGEDIAAKLEGKGKTPVSEVVNPLLQSIEGFEQMTFSGIGQLVALGGMIKVGVIWDNILAATVAEQTGLPFAPTIAVMDTLNIAQADITIIVQADKDMKLVSLSATVAFEASVVAEDTEYSADIDASANCTFGYAAASAVQKAA